MRVLMWVLQVIAVLWVVRVLWRTVAGWLGVLGGSSQFAGSGPRRSNPVRPDSGMAPKELVKDPQCGTFVSPELSIRARSQGRELHFCSRECEQKFFQAQSAKSA